MTTSKFYKSFFIILIQSVLLFHSCIIEESEKPNIIYINVDDLGWVDTEIYGSTYYETPHINKLAESGMRFTRAYASAANCAPSRACLLTGLNTPRHGIYTVNSSERGKSEHRKLIPFKNTTVLADSFVTIAEVLQLNGYRTGTFGKWHLGDDPTTQGFEINFGGDKRGNPGPEGYFNPSLFPNMEEVNQGINLTDELTSRAIQFIKNSRDQPFFLYLPYYAVHTPLRAKNELIKKYAAKSGNDFHDNEVFAAMIDNLDQNVGRILTYLEKKRLLHNTIIIFTSDNGGLRSISSMYPLRGCKGSYYEGGIRIPLIVSWENKIESGSINHAPTTNLDFFPTVLDILQIESSSFKPDGHSILPLLTGSERESKPMFWHFPVYLQSYDGIHDDTRDSLFRTRPGSVVIIENWKLHQYFEDDSSELYNLDDDIGERKDLSQVHIEKRNELLDTLNAWRKATNAPIPSEQNPLFSGH